MGARCLSANYWTRALTPQPSPRLAPISGKRPPDRSVLAQLFRRVHLLVGVMAENKHAPKFRCRCIVRSYFTREIVLLCFLFSLFLLPSVLWNWPSLEG